MFQYTVQPGDTLTKIAQAQCNGSITADKIAADNHITNRDLIFVGQVLELDCVGHAAAPVPHQFLFGVDASERVNWQTAKNNGAVFAFSEFFGNNGSRPNIHFSENWDGMKAVNLIRGAYHLILPSVDVTYQANLFVDQVKLAPTDFPPVLDVEARGVTASQLRTWLSIVEAGTHRKPIIYTSQGRWISSSNFGDYPLWVANYGASTPAMPRGWTKWLFWQYQAKTSFDNNYFNGTLDDLNNFVATH